MATSPHPFLQAARGGDRRVLQELARVVVSDAGSTCALCVAAEHGLLDVCKFLVEELRVDVNRPNEKGDTALLVSAIFGTFAVAKYFLDNGADPRIAGRSGSPLHAAAANGKCYIVELLLSRGVHVDDFNSTHGTPLHAAASFAQHGTMKILLDHHADPNKVRTLHITPLSSAILKKSLECVKLLVEAGADVNYADYIGVTHLMVATFHGLSDIVSCLLNAGADPTCNVT